MAFLCMSQRSDVAVTNKRARFPGPGEHTESIADEEHIDTAPLPEPTNVHWKFPWGLSAIANLPALRVSKHVFKRFIFSAHKTSWDNKFHQLVSS